MRLGLFGGSFDPVHYGHLLLAETCREARQLDQVWFVPAATSPHKQGQTSTDGADRLAMLELAVGGSESLLVSRIEIDRGGVSYTVDTLAAIRQAQPEAELFFLLGADSLHDLPSWREPERICELASLVVVARAGDPPPNYDCLRPLVAAERVQAFRELQVDMPLMQFSSSEIRRAVAAGRSIRFQTPRAVEQYIAEHQLYRDR
jgi:nicotinate-nucleotide adenylyltransferase